MKNTMNGAERASAGKEQYDLIGDIHGYASMLRALLAQLGYEQDGLGVYRHEASRRVIFLGDYIDRGPEVRETLQIVRGMVETGTALAIMGNHEFNALCYHTRNSAGRWLRDHGSRNRAVHQETLDQFDGCAAEWHGYLEWFMTLPLWLDLPTDGLRAVHACWDEGSMAVLPPDGRLTPTLLQAAAQKGTSEYAAVEILLKGREMALPPGHQFKDGRGFVRTDIRVKWWINGEGHTYRQLVFPDCETVPDTLPSLGHLSGWTAYPPDAPPVFIGHYWLPGALDGEPPKLITANIACLDYSVAKGGPLTGYCWTGGGPLDSTNFVQQPAVVLQPNTSRAKHEKVLATGT